MNVNIYMYADMTLGCSTMLPFLHM